MRTYPASVSSPRPRRHNVSPQSVIELTLDRAANDGASVGRDEDGRAVFADGGLPGETVRVSLETQKKRFARGRVIEVLAASPGRVEPTCPTHVAGCGGCDLAHASAHLQHDVKQRVVEDALVRIGRCDADVVSALLGANSVGPAGESTGYRTTVRAAIHKGRAGYRKRSSHNIVSAIACGVAHPLVAEMLVEGRFAPGSGDEVVLRASAATGERVALISGDAFAVDLPDDVVVVSRDELKDGREVSIVEHAAGRDWQVSAESFFQAGPTVASALVDAVAAAAGSVEGLRVVDAYAGIGLFGGTVAATASELWSVERSRSSSRDAHVNLSGLPATIIEKAVEDWAGVEADVVIADPARSGLGAEGANSLVSCGAQRFVLVSCDTGSLGRDVGLLQQQGYVLDSLRIVDAFHDTSHVETVVGLRLD